MAGNSWLGKEEHAAGGGYATAREKKTQERKKMPHDGYGDIRKKKGHRDLFKGKNDREGRRRGQIDI